MATTVADSTWHDAQRHVDQAELAETCGLTIAEIEELVEFGALLPLVAEAGTGRQFSASCVAPLREAMRLRAHYDLDLFTVSLLLEYLQRIAHLEHQLRGLHAHVPHPQPLPREGPAPWREPHA